MSRPTVLVAVAVAGLLAFFIAKQMIRYDARCQSGDAITELMRNRPIELRERAAISHALAATRQYPFIHVLDVRGPRLIVSDTRTGHFEALGYNLTGKNERDSKFISDLWHTTWLQFNSYSTDPEPITPVDVATGSDADRAWDRISVSPYDCVSL